MDVLGTIAAVVVLVGFGYFIYRKVTAKKTSTGSGGGTGTGTGTGTGGGGGGGHPLPKTQQK